MISGSEMDYSTTSDSMKMEDICLKKARQARRKRLEIQRLKSIASNENLSSYGNNNNSDDQNQHHRKMKMNKLRNKVVPSCESDSTLEIKSKDGNSINSISKQVDGELGPSFSMSSKNDIGQTVGIIVAGGSELFEEEELRRLPCVSHGSVSVCGRRREMEDAVTVVPGLVSDLDYDFFAVYDGHGGSVVANICKDQLHRVLVKEIQEGLLGQSGKKRTGGFDGVEEEMIDWEHVMVSSFLKMDEEVSGGRSGIDVDDDMKSIGSTAVVALVGSDKIIVANCGDSRAVLSRGGVAVPLSRDHRPDRYDELERVEAAGGRVINWNGYRVLGVLATSRSIGDYYLKPYVISVPEVTVTSRNKSDELLILASDGLWDVLSNEVACDVARRCLGGRITRRFSSNTSRNGSGAADAAAVLAELAMARGSKDNISVVVIELKKLSR